MVLSLTLVLALAAGGFTTRLPAGKKRGQYASGSLAGLFHRSAAANPRAGDQVDLFLNNEWWGYARCARFVAGSAV